MSIVNEQLKIFDKALELINTAIRQIDDITKGIKNWAIVTWTASVGLALGSKHLTSLT